MIPVIAAGIAGLATFVGATLLSKKTSAGTSEPSAPGSSPNNTFVPFVPSGNFGTAPDQLFFAKPFEGRPPPITNAQRQAIIDKPAGTLTFKDIANLTVDFTPEQTAALSNSGTTGLFSAADASTLDKTEAARQGVSVEEMLKRTGGPINLPRAEVTTSQSSPAGDLRVLNAPSTTAQQIGGAPKGGIVTVININAGGEFAEIAWGGGFGFPAVIKYPGVRGFVKKQFLVIQ